MPTNLCGTVIGNELTEFAKEHLAKGNQKSADCEYIYIDAKLKAKFNLVSKHKVRGVTIYSFSYDIEIVIDLLNPNSSDAELCFNTIAGKFCINVQEIIELLKTLLKMQQNDLEVTQNLSSALKLK